MSTRDDDDLEDKIERLIDEMGELTELMRFAMTQGRPEETTEEETGPEDLWDSGTSVSVASISEFKRWRKKAATEEGVSTPYFTTDDLGEYDSKMEAHVGLFLQGYQNLEELYSTLGESGFAEFVREFAKASSDPSVAGSGIINADLVDILEPSPSFFGIQVVEGDIQVNPGLTPFNFIQTYGYIWHSSAEPNIKLGMPETDDVVPILGSLEAREVNEKMADLIDGRKGLSLPDKYKDLL